MFYSTGQLALTHNKLLEITTAFGLIGDLSGTINTKQDLDDTVIKQRPKQQHEQQQKQQLEHAVSKKYNFIM